MAPRDERESAGVARQIRAYFIRESRHRVTETVSPCQMAPHSDGVRPLCGARCAPMRTAKNSCRMLRCRSFHYLDPMPWPTPPKVRLGNQCLMRRIGV